MDVSSMCKMQIVVLAGLLLICVLCSAAPPQCVKDHGTCLRASECCGGCCEGEKCVPYADGCLKATNPCTLHQCLPGKSCYLNQVACVASPCPPVPACRDDDYKDYET